MVQEEFARGRLKNAGYVVRGPWTRTGTEDVLEATGGLDYYQRQIR